ncbi:hypothetical protein BYT27DRAFT_7216834 [Phlegmacium glaucopus]|nr:hypothetical protein BYT27DRAFT_7216834 [Phlegmacium glaucopus]
MPQLPAIATFIGKVVTVEATNTSGQVVSTFSGKTTKERNGKSVGHLTYQVLPEGVHKMDLSIIPQTLTLPWPPPGVEIKFSPAHQGPFDRCFQFEGGPFGDVREGDNGGGTWKSVVNFDLWQQVYLLSLFSNKIQNEKDSVDKLAVIARKQITAAVSGLGWHVVWGPTVWKNDPDNKLTGPDHVWFVAKKREENIYAISVAATATIYNHVVNNAGITQVVDFKGWPAGQRPTPTSSSLTDPKPYIAYGTAQGVHTLLSLPAPDGTKQTLPEFLKTARGSAPQFIFTGFSLGGALSPTLALRLVNIGVFTDNDNVLTYPIAGASPGNAHFADSFANRFPKITTSDGLVAYQVWNGNVANSLDVVPNGWSTVTDTKQSLRLDRIPTEIYGNKPITSVNWKIGRAKDAANKSGIVYMPLQSTLFKGPTPTPPSNEDEFLAIARKQHSEAYHKYFIIKLPGGTQHLSSQEAEVTSVKVGASGVDDAEEEDLFPDVVIGI